MNHFEKMVQILKGRKQTISCMESCTGGAFANALTNVEGASSVFSFGAVTYSNAYKIKMGVPASIIDSYSVYSRQTARFMAKSSSTFANADYGIGITGKLGKADLQNLVGDNHMVYISVYDRETDHYIDQTITLEVEAREKAKQVIIELTVHMVLKVLGKK